MQRISTDNYNSSYFQPASVNINYKRLNIVLLCENVYLSFFGTVF